MATIGTRGDKLDLVIRQGATLGPFDVTIQEPDGDPMDLTGVTFRAAVRKTYGDLTAYTIDTEITDAALGKFAFTMDADITATIPYLGDIRDQENHYVWDLEAEFDVIGGDNIILPFFWGKVRVAGEVTL